jgi:hypothetical protein
MKKVIIMLCLSLLPFAYVYPQIETETVCKRSIENIFKVLAFRDKYESVQFIYEHKHRAFFKYDTFKKNSFLNQFFERVRDIPYDGEPKDSIPTAKPGEIIKAEFMPKDEMDHYLERLNYTPEDAYKEYKDYIQQIKLDKDTYLKCINAELAKGDESEFAKNEVWYGFMRPGSSQTPPSMTKLDFLKVFKEFILHDDYNILPEDYLRVKAYLSCGCKI